MTEYTIHGIVYIRKDEIDGKGGTKNMKTYNTLQDLVKTVRVSYAKKTEFGWVAKRTGKNASHSLVYIFSYGQLDRNMVVATEVQK